MKKRLTLFLGLILLLAGCTTGQKEFIRAVVGDSTKEVEDSRPSAVKKTFGYSYNECYQKTKAALKKIGSYVYAENKAKQLIAVFVSDTDTTPVGIFLTSIDEKDTQVEVSSPSSYAREQLAGRIFAELEAKPVSQTEGEKTDAKEQQLEYK